MPCYVSLKGGGCLCVFWVKDRMFGSVEEEGLCVLMQNPVCSHTCAQWSTSVCVFSAKLPDGCYLPESDRQGSWRGAPIIWSAILSRKFDPPWGNLSCCSTFLIPVWWQWGEGYLLLFAVDIQVSIHKHLCNRPVKVTKKFVWPCYEIFFICFFFLLFGTEVAQAVIY